MGSSIAWMALKGLSRDDVMVRCDLAEGEAGDGEFWIGEIRPGWTVLVTPDFEFVSPRRLELVSAGTDVIGGHLEEHVMVSSLQAYRQGLRLWAGVHHPEQADGHFNFDLVGTPPPELTAVIARRRADQEVEDAGGASVDHLFGVPMAFTDALTGYSDDEIAFDDDPRFLMASRSPGGPRRDPLDQSWDKVVRAIQAEADKPVPRAPASPRRDPLGPSLDEVIRAAPPAADEPVPSPATRGPMDGRELQARRQAAVFRARLSAVCAGVAGLYWLSMTGLGLLFGLGSGPAWVAAFAGGLLASILIAWRGWLRPGLGWSLGALALTGLTAVFGQAAGWLGLIWHAACALSLFALGSAWTLSRLDRELARQGPS